ncbi:MAG: FMN-binding protein [Acidaminococcaceae bacterium]|nr:FMN-binding protein [Acidaminococcaceae bacterium]MBQ9635486.1 FMN-binding protein [Acidaminococcaceae bacterium]MBQ9697867.1 FMN-binding protein [Acidaminococcaceae bacterium]MBR1590420.1 FMN-binding protein [Acidaminococcaceae bacterium]
MKRNITKAAGFCLVCLLAASMAACGSEKKPAQQAPGKGKENLVLSDYRPPKIDTAGLLAKAKDGTFKGVSERDEEGEYCELTLTIAGHKITDAKFAGFLKDGTLKDKEYGKTNGKIENKVYYNKAQLALKANDTYAAELVKKQELNKVDAVSGATVSYKGLFEAGQMALEKAIK